MPEATARAVEDAGLRATIGAPLIDVGDRGRRGELRDGAERSLDELGPARALIAPALAPHAIYTVSERVAALDRRAGRRSASCRCTSTSPRPRTRWHDCVAAHGARPAEYLDRLGLLGPRTLLAHGVWLDEEELELIAAARRDRRHQPGRQHEARGRRRLPLPRGARRRRRRSASAPTAPGSNDSLDLFADLKLFALLQKHAGGRSRRGERRRGVGDRHRPSRAAARGGNLAAGRAGRLPAAARGLAPSSSLGDFTAGLVYAASGAVVDTTVVNGRVLMRGGTVEGEDEVLARALERARRLGLR